MKLPIILSLVVVLSQTATKVPAMQENAAQSQICLPSIKPTLYIVWIDTCAARYKIPREVILGVAANESSFGASNIGRSAHNWFGIKKGDCRACEYYTTKSGAKYRKYQSPYESIEDFCCYIRQYYPHLIGRELERWKLNGYAAEPYTAAYFKKFTDF